MEYKLLLILSYYFTYRSSRKHDRVVKMSDLSPDGPSPAWVRTPLLPSTLFPS